MDIMALVLYGLLRSLPLLIIGILMQRTLSPVGLRLPLLSNDSFSEGIREQAHLRQIRGNRIWRGFPWLVFQLFS